MTANTAHWLGFVIQQCVSCCPVTQRQPSDFIFFLFFFLLPPVLQKACTQLFLCFPFSPRLGSHSREHPVFPGRTLTMLCRACLQGVAEGHLGGYAVEKAYWTDGPHRPPLERPVRKTPVVRTQRLTSTHPSRLNSSTNMAPIHSCSPWSGISSPSLSVLVLNSYKCSSLN